MPLVVIFLLVASAAAAQSPPVILIDGYHLLCSNDNLSSIHDFGELQQRLESQGKLVTFVGTCSFSGKPSIEELGNSLGAAIRNLNVPEVDVISHSLGGLVVRSYLSGKQSASGVFNPPADPKIRKWISIATPNFGALIPGLLANFLPDIQTRELVPGNQFLFDLATWNQNRDDLRGVDAIGLVGNAGGVGPIQGFSDGTVSVISATLTFALPQERTRVLPYCHGAGDLTSILGLGCDAPPIAKIQSDNPLAWQAINSFLAGQDDWKTIGQSPAQDRILSVYGGVVTQSRDNMDNPKGSITDSGAISNPPTTGAYTVLIDKPGPQIALVAPSAARLPFLSLAPRMLVSIYGNNLAGSTVSVGGVTLKTNFVGEHQINALLPPALTGVQYLTVVNAAGSQSVRNLLEDAVPAIFTADASGTGPAAALRVGDYLELFLTGLGQSRGPFMAFLNGSQVLITYAGPAPGFEGLDQVNVLLPSGTFSGSVLLQAGRRRSNTVTVPAH